MKALFRCEKNWQKINVQRFSANFFSLKTESAAQSPIPVILRHSPFWWSGGIAYHSMLPLHHIAANTQTY